MINILMNTYNIVNPAYIEELKNYIKPHHRVCVIPFAFREKEIPTNDIWQNFYAEDRGIYRQGMESMFSRFNIGKSQISYINYFEDSPKTAFEKCSACDILYFTGGLPDKLYDRLKEFKLVELLSRHSKIMMGDSAGAVIQFRQFHLSPDADYPHFSYYNGLDIIKNFELEVHYADTAVQNESIQKVITEKKIPVVALPDDSILIVDNLAITSLGLNKIFLPVSS